jgi:hypothetical protein
MIGSDNNNNSMSQTKKGTMAVNAQFGAVVLERLGLDPLSEDHDTQAMVVASKRLKELDEARPDLGVRQRVQEVLDDENPARRFLDLLVEFQPYIETTA